MEEPAPQKLSLEAVQVRLAHRPTHEQLLSLIENGTTKIIATAAQKPMLFGAKDDGLLYVLDLSPVFVKVHDESLVMKFIRNFISLHEITLTGFIIESVRVASVKHGDPDDDALLAGKIATADHPRKMDTLSIFIQDAASIDHHMYQVLGKPGTRELGQRETYRNTETKWRFYGTGSLKH